MNRFLNAYMQSTSSKLVGLALSAVFGVLISMGGVLLVATGGDQVLQSISTSYCSQSSENRLKIRETVNSHSGGAQIYVWCPGDRSLVDQLLLK